MQRRAVRSLAIAVAGTLGATVLVVLALAGGASATAGTALLLPTLAATSAAAVAVGARRHPVVEVADLTGPAVLAVLALASVASGSSLGSAAAAVAAVVVGAGVTAWLRDGRTT